MIRTTLKELELVLEAAKRVEARTRLKFVLRDDITIVAK